jgi:hypothetical protein
MHAGDVVSASVGRAPESDEFDRWVSGREDSVVTSTNAALHYSNSYNYTSGFGDLYTYGGFYPISGFGYGWQPYGVGIGWSPFDYGNWYFQSGLGWSFIGNQPWGWLPYHYGGWIFQPGIGWLWAPTGFGGGGLPVRFHPVTATFVRSGNSVGIVPSHPLDNHGKTPVNIAQGVMPLTSRAGTSQAALATGSQWKVVKEPPRAALVSHASTATAPARVTRSVSTSNAAVGNAAQGGSSSIVYDAKERRFVNGNMPASSSAKVSTPPTSKDSVPAAIRTSPAAPKTTPASARAEMPSRSASARVGPPPAPRSTVFTRGESVGGGSRSRGASMSTSSAPRATSPAAAPAPRATGRPH